MLHSDNKSKIHAIQRKSHIVINYRFIVVMMEEFSASKDFEKVGLHLRIRDVFSILQFETAFRNIEQYSNFCDSYDIPKKQRLVGLKLALRCIQEQHLNELDYSFFPELDASEVFFRSSKSERRKLPIKDKLDALSRQAYESLSSLLNATNLSDMHLEHKKNLSPYLLALSDFFKKNVLVENNTGDISSQQLLEITSIQFFVDSLLNSARSKVLDSHLSPIARSRGKDQYVLKNWEGYLAAVAFFYNEIYEGVLDDISIKSILDIKREQSLFEIGKKIENSLEKLILEKIGTDEMKFVFQESVDISPFESLIQSVPQPIKREPHEELDIFLEMEGITVFDCRGKFHSGPATLIRLISGEVSYIEREKGELPTQIVRFSHPSSEGNRFSYGVFVRSNPSGWVVFKWCGNDYSGGSTKTYLEIENELKQYGKRVQIRDYSISLEDFNEYEVSKSFQHRGGIKHLTDEESAKYLVNMANQLVEDVAGLFFELTVAMIFANWGFRVNWAVRDSSMKNAEIDVTARTDGECYIIECSHRLSAVDINETKKLVDRFKIRLEALSKMDGYKDLILHRIFVTRNFHFLDKRMKDSISTLISEGIIVNTLEGLLEDSDLHKGDIDKLHKAIKKLDCWRPGENGFTGGSRILDIKNCYDMMDFPFLDTVGFLDTDNDNDETE